MFRFLCWLSRNNLLPRFVWSVGGDNAGWANFYFNLPFMANVVVSGEMICDVAVYDYSDGRIYIYRGAPTMTGEELDEFVEAKGHHLSSSEYMAWHDIEIVERRA